MSVHFTRQWNVHLNRHENNEITPLLPMMHRLSIHVFPVVHKLLHFASPCPTNRTRERRPSVSGGPGLIVWSVTEFQELQNLPKQTGFVKAEPNSPGVKTHLISYWIHPLVSMCDPQLSRAMCPVKVL